MKKIGIRSDIEQLTKTALTLTVVRLSSQDCARKYGSDGSLTYIRLCWMKQVGGCGSWYVEGIRRSASKIKIRTAFSGPLSDDYLARWRRPFSGRGKSALTKHSSGFRESDATIRLSNATAMLWSKCRNKGKGIPPGQAE